MKQFLSRQSSRVKAWLRGRFHRAPFLRFFRPRPIFHSNPFVTVNTLAVGDPDNFFAEMEHNITALQAAQREMNQLIDQAFYANVARVMRGDGRQTSYSVATGASWEVTIDRHVQSGNIDFGITWRVDAWGTRGRNVVTVSEPALAAFNPIPTSAPEMSSYISMVLQERFLPAVQRMLALHRLLPRPDEMQELERHIEHALNSTVDHFLHRGAELPVGWARVPSYNPVVITAEATKKAEELLYRCLSESQKKEYEVTHTFTVVNKQTGLEYVVYPKGVQNVIEKSTGDILCVQLAERAPVADLMLACKLLIENTPEEYFSTAKRSSPVSLEITNRAAAMEASMRAFFERGTWHLPMRRAQEWESANVDPPARP